MFCVISSLSPESAWQSHSPVIAGEARQSYKKEIWLFNFPREVARFRGRRHWAKIGEERKACSRLGALLLWI